MTIYYSFQTKGFYDSSTSPTIPSAAVVIMPDQYASLLLGQASGMVIGPDANGNPILSEPTPLTNSQQAQVSYNAAIAVGCAIISTSMPTLNGTYAITDAAQIKLNGEQTYIAVTGNFTNGQGSRSWMDISCGLHMFADTKTFTVFAEALTLYIDGLVSALATAQSENTPWVAPTNSVTIP
jgi:hypothetical protein